MKPWIEDILDQLNTAHILAHAGISCGERLAMIIVDNAVEYMCKTYVEVHRRRLVPKVIKRKDLNTIKENFSELLEFVANQEPRLQPHVSDINSYHSVRNGLYHGGQPITVKVPTVDDYSRIATTVLEVLIGVTENQQDRDRRITVIHTALLGEAKKEIKAGVEFESVNDAVRFSTKVNVPLRDAICLVLLGFAKEVGSPPTLEQLESSLALSAYTPTRQTISSRLSELRKEGFVRKDHNALTDRGSKNLLNKYL